MTLSRSPPHVTITATSTRPNVCQPRPKSPSALSNRILTNKYCQVHCLLRRCIISPPPSTPSRNTLSFLTMERDWWAFEVNYVDAEDDRSEVAVELRNLRDPHALPELSPVGQMSQTNCASLVNLAKSGTLKFYLNVI